MAACLAELIGTLVFDLLFWVLLLPLTLIVSTPFVLILGAFSPGPYAATVRARYRGVVRFWRNTLEHLFV